MENNKMLKIRGKDRNFPPATIGLAEDVLKAISNSGGRMDTKALEIALRTKGGALSRKISSARRWNLVEGSGILTITDIGKKILHPLSKEELPSLRKTAFLSVPLFSELYNRFGNKSPEHKTFKAILIREYNLNENNAKIVVGIYKDSVKNFLSLIEDKEIKISKEGTEKNENEFDDEITSKKKIIIKITSPIGRNVFYAENKKDFEKLKQKINSIGDLIDWDVDKKKGEENES